MFRYWHKNRIDIWFHTDSFNIGFIIWSPEVAGHWSITFDVGFLEIGIDIGKRGD